MRERHSLQLVGTENEKQKFEKCNVNHSPDCRELSDAQDKAVSAVINV